ncbi:MAG: hypothetical protein D6702_03645 [Planctomycetota bacterium]|nr:MAG: hypothetical protein D6702_03645 [Planctomycetota bacterium]
MNPIVQRILSRLAAALALAVSAPAQHEGHAGHPADGAWKLPAAPDLKPQSVCPISGEKPGAGDTEKVSVVSQGQQVRLCRPMGKPRLQADPDTSSRQAAAAKVGFAPASGNCPVSGKPAADPTLWVTWQGRRDHFCCEKCVGKFMASPAEFAAKA